ncbi:MAG: DrmB family protein, partial [Mycobacterium sp.]
GSARPSHLMFTSGVGALIDLPNFSVLVKGLDDWRHDERQEAEIAEPRLLRAIRTMKDGLPSVAALKRPPWLPEMNDGSDKRIGVPTIPFPNWMRCTVCNVLAPIESATVFGFENDKEYAPHDARFSHTNCPGTRKKKKPLGVGARFLMACTNGHLDDFPYVEFVHRGQPCEVDKPQLTMDDRGGNAAANVILACERCGARRSMREAQGQQGLENLPQCRGRHPHLGTFEPNCKGQRKLLIVGASNQWFAKVLSTLWVPEGGATALQAKVEQYWDAIADLPGGDYAYGRKHVSAFKHFVDDTDEEIAAAVEVVREKKEIGTAEPEGYPDLRTPEWEIFSAKKLPDGNELFTARRDLDGVPADLKGVYADIVHVERLREVRALVGFTRLDAPDPEDPELVVTAPLARDTPSWVPASEVRGEGIFLRLPEDLLRDWEQRVAESELLDELRGAYGRFRENRYSDRIPTDFDKFRYWPGARYIVLHTLAHLLIRTISLECGYSSASLSERIYTSTEDERRAGILIYTAVPDAEGTLGGLVSLAEPDSLTRITRRALVDARHCSSDPLCAARMPAAPADYVYGAACHVCAFVSETTCENGNRFLDRRLVVPVGSPKLALFPEIP